MSFPKPRMMWWAIAALPLALFLAACKAPVSQPKASASPDRRVVVTYGVFEDLPLTEKEALSQGWVDVDPGECVPRMGRHFIRMGDNGQPGPLILLFNPSGALIGVELESMTEQPSPPWEHLEKGHPGMEFEHWTVHFWLGDPAEACAS